MADDPLAKWRKPGSKPAEAADGIAVAPLSGIRPREYKAYISEAARVPMLRIRSSLVKQPRADLILPYTSLIEVTSDGYGFFVGLIFSVPFPVGAMTVKLRGEGLTPLIEGIAAWTVKTVQLFDPDRFLPPNEGDFDAEADEWRGPCVVRDISITEQGEPLQSATKH
jgi:hypothetical protein